MLQYAEWKILLKFVFQHDDNSKYTAKLIKDWFVENKVLVLKWLSQSPNLNAPE